MSSLDKRPLIAFFDYPDVFEDFYPHYGVTQKAFATTWVNTANHQWIRIIQREIGDVIWYVNCIKPEQPESKHRVVGCTIKFLPSNLAHRILWNLFYLPSFSWKWQRFYRFYAVIASYLSPFSWHLWKLLRTDKPDVLFVQDYCSGRYDILLLFAFLLKIPLITFHSGSTPDKYLGKALRKFTLNKADWIFPSGKNEQKLLERKFGIKTQKTCIIRPPINTEVYRPIDRKMACMEAGLNQHRRYVIFVGRLQDSVKRISVIIKVFSEIVQSYDDVELLIVGSGADESSLKNLAQKIIPGRIHFQGWIADDNTKAVFYNVAECLVLNSWREASPAVIGEAFSCGIPVISSNVGGIDDLVTQNTSGWLFPVGNDSLFHKYLAEALENPDRLRRMRKNIRQMAIKKVSEGAITQSLKLGFFSTLAYENEYPV